MPEVSGSDVTNAGWDLLQMLVHESQLWHLRVWNKALPSSIENYSAFEKQLLALLLGLIKSQYLIMNPSYCVTSATYHEFSIICPTNP